MSAPSVKYCRFCAEEKSDEELIDLALYSYLHEEIQQKLASLHTDIDLSLTILPTTVCFSCRNSLTNAYDFLLKIKSAQTTLNKHFLKIETPQLDLDILKSEGGYNYCHHFLEELVNEVHSPKSIDDEEATDSKISVSEHNIQSTETEIEPIITENTSTPLESSWATYPWICQFCDQNFSDVDELREHCRDDHCLCHYMKCADCQKSFTNYERFVKHVREHRSELIDYCQYCNIKVEPNNTRAHKQTHTKHQHICPHCGKAFQNPERQKRHTKKYKPLKRSWFYVLPKWEINDLDDKTWTGYYWTCQLCNTKFKALDELRSHTKEVHKKCFAVKCMDCDEICDSYKSFVHHVRRHRPHMKQYCHYCNHKFPTKEVDTEHVAQHFSHSQKSCQTCGEMFPSRVQLDLHTAAYSPTPPRSLPYLRRETPLSADDLTCDVCGKVTKSQNALRGHRLLHTARRRDYTCEVCGKAFYTKGALTTHRYTHEEAQPEVCKICKRAFKTLTVLKQHVKTHKGEKPFECAVCQRRFRLNKQMEQHSIIHTDTMPHKCQYCEKAFRHKTNLKTHEHQHTGARPYACRECTMTFSNWANCNKHMKRRHGVTLAKSSMTEHGKLPVNAETGKVRVLKDVATAMEWTERILRPCRRGKKKLDVAAN